MLTICFFSPVLSSLLASSGLHDQCGEMASGELWRYSRNICRRGSRGGMYPFSPHSNAQANSRWFLLQSRVLCCGGAIPHNIIEIDRSNIKFKSLTSVFSSNTVKMFVNGLEVWFVVPVFHNACMWVGVIAKLAMHEKKCASVWMIQGFIRTCLLNQNAASTNWWYKLGI